MSTEIPDITDIPPEVVTWWDTLTDQERICAALAALENGTLPDAPSSVAERPWRYARYAYNFAHQQPGEDP